MDRPEVVGVRGRAVRRDVDSGTDGEEIVDVGDEGGEGAEVLVELDLDHVGVGSLADRGGPDAEGHSEIPHSGDALEGGLELALGRAGLDGGGNLPLVVYGKRGGGLRGVRGALEELNLVDLARGERVIAGGALNQATIVPGEPFVADAAVNLVSVPNIRVSVLHGVLVTGRTGKLAHGDASVGWQCGKQVGARGGDRGGVYGGLVGSWCA